MREARLHFRRALVIRPHALRNALNGARGIADGQVPQHARRAHDAMRGLDDLCIHATVQGLLQVGEVLLDCLGKQVDDEAPLLQVEPEQLGQCADDLRGEQAGDDGVTGLVGSGGCGRVAEGLHGVARGFGLEPHFACRAGLQQ